MKTHDVLNQSTPLVGLNLLDSDPLLGELIKRYNGDRYVQGLWHYGQFAGSEHAAQLAVEANRNEPVLHTHSRFGDRRDEVTFHPAWHELMGKAVESMIHSLPWFEPTQGTHVGRAALMYMAYQNEAGHCCPISMTYSAVPALRKQPDLAAIWEPRVVSNQYDPRFMPSEGKKGVLFGMGMTEKQGGSDVRANTSRAVPVAARGGGQPYLLTGHKWFTSAPMCDAFLILAQTEKGVSCFLVPRWLPDGKKNNIFIQRLKEKLGNRSNASSEIEFENALGWLVGDEGRGVPTIIEMVNHTRLDCTLGATALMRQATVQAVHHCSGRAAFGKKLIDQPLMINVLADLAVEWEAAMRMTFRVASAYDKPATSEPDLQFKRLASAVAKYWVCKRSPMHVAEALECFGGNGYVEEGPMPRLFRESPLNGIWEGSGNVICLDVLRAIAKEPEAIDAFLAEIELAQGLSSHVDRHVKSLKSKLTAMRKTVVKHGAAAIAGREAEARLLVEQMALALQGSLMLRHASSPAANAFIASRIRKQSGLALGTLPATSGLREIVDGVMAK